MDIIEYLYLANLLAGYDETDEAKNDINNFMSELGQLDAREGKIEAYRKFASENPNDPLSRIAVALANGEINRKMLVWDWERTKAVAEISELIRKLAYASDEDATVNAELTGFTDSDLCITVELSQDSSFGIPNRDIEDWRKIVNFADSFDVCALEDGRIQLTFAFFDVRNEA